MAETSEASPRRANRVCVCGANGASLDTEEPIFSVLVAGARFSVHPGGGLVRCQQGQCSYLPAEKVQHIPRTHNLASTRPALIKKNAVGSE